MSRRAARWLAAAYFAAYTVALTWPGYTLFNRIEPFVFGLPFSFAWPALWVALAVPVLWLLHRAEGRAGEGE